MSIVVSTDVFCDGDDCNTWATTATATGVRVAAKEARETARTREGWVTGLTGGRDLCPHCAAQEKEAAR